jgi:hypothetical protein
MADMYCYSYVEDQPSAEVARKIVDARNLLCDNSLLFRDGFPSVLGGSGGIKKKAPSFLEMARGGLYTFILTDLDSEECPPTLIRKWFPTVGDPALLPKETVFRVAVREVEAWILADRDAFAKFMGIPKANFPEFPDDLDDPKQHLLGVLRRKGRKKRHREMLPRGNAHIGPGYNAEICRFIEKKWSPLRAAAKSPSLRRAIEALKRL